MIVGSLLTAMALGFSPGAVATTAAAQPSTTVGVGAREYAFAVYRPAVPAGRVTFVVHNFGEDDHDLAVRGPHGYRSATSADVAPDGTLHVTTRLRRPGRYLLVCTKPGHLAKGMEATLRVR